MADAGDSPGSLVEAFHVNVPPVAPLVLTPISSTLHPVLNAGSQYWVAVTGGTPTTFGLWGLTLLTGDTTPGGASRSINNGVDLGWTRNVGTRVGALDVIGYAIPEPASLLLIGTGLLFLTGLHRLHGEDRDR